MDAAVGPSSVLLAGGGSAGHVSPLLAVADALRRRDPAVRVTALGTATGLEARLVPARGYELRFVPRVPLPRRPDPALLRLPGALRGAVAAARTAIDESGAEVVVGFGGYVSTPAYLAARQRRIPIVVHEQNARAGLANRVGARMTPFVATTFRGTVLPNASVLGMPLRREVSQLDRAARRQEGMAAFGLDPQWPTLLVTGGSLGAQRLNVSFAERAAELSAAGVQVLHVTGAGKEFEPERPEVGASYVVIPYADRMELAYAAADLVVCRAGANTVCELTAVGLPAVYVPLPIGNGEQRFNAADVLAVAGGLVVDDASFTPEWITDNVLPLAADGERLRSMGEAAASVGQRDADEALAEMIHRAYAARLSVRASSAGRPGEPR
jgi:UDP-N-acetylglucosamine--N-acetylmuramyl-(pentapeptide) pyrophosphoryl-undecaprenol N-acetylglucosamine transferase